MFVCWCTATDHKNNLNSSALKKNYARTLRVETIANSAGGTAEVAIVAQPSTGFLNTRFYPDGSPTEDTEDCLGSITVGLTRSKSFFSSRLADVALRLGPYMRVSS